MKTIKIEVLDGCVHCDGNIYKKGETFEIDDKNGKSLIENNVAREVVLVETKIETKKKDNQAEVFDDINKDLTPNKDKK